MAASPHAFRKTRVHELDEDTSAGDSPDAGLIARLQSEIEALQRESAGLKWGEAERKRTERALSESEQKFMLALTNSPTVLFHQDPDLRYTWMYNSHPAFSSVNFIGKADAEVLPPEDAARLTAIKRQVLETGVGAREEIQATIDGVPYYYDLTVEPSINERGETIGIKGVSHDITERKRAVEAMRQSNESYRTIVETVNEGIWEQDNQHITLRVNPMMAAMLGYSVDEMVGRPVPDFLFEEEIKVLHTRLQAQRSEGPRGKYECRLKHRDGTARWVLVSATPKKDKSGNSTGSFAMFTDITDRKQAEEALQRHAEDLARLNQELTSSHREANLYLDILTHDLGNTENVSNLYADLLIETLQGEAVGYAEKLQRSIKKSIEILGTVGKIRRIHFAVPGLEATDLDAVIREEADHYPDSSIRCKGIPCQVQADDLLTEVFANLIGNAVKHGGPDVAITVRTEEEDGFVQVTVEDTGPGVPDDHKTEIFHRYEQHKRGVGEGLGLYLVQILVERYGGKIWVEDRVPGRPEEGAAFRFTLKKV